MHINPLVPELLVTDIARSLDFWCRLMAFQVLFDRPEEGFAYLQHPLGAQVMLERESDYWSTGPRDHPYGRGINFQFLVEDADAMAARVAAQWPLFRPVEERWYRAGDGEEGVRQFLVQDPDGYLLRPQQDIGRRALTSGPMDK